MDLNDIMLVLHIAAAGSWLGANMIQVVVPRMAAKQSPEVGAGWYRIAGQLSVKFYMPVAFVILATGVMLVLGTDEFTFESLFVTIGIAVVIIGALLGKLVFHPGSEKAAEAVEAADQAMIKSATGRLATFGAIDTLLVLFAITAMVLKWGI